MNITNLKALLYYGHGRAVSSVLSWTYSSLAADTVGWWAQVDSNHRPRADQARALTTWAMSPFDPSVYLVLLSTRSSLSSPHRLTKFGCRYYRLVEMMGIEPMTPCLQGRCSPSWATPPYFYMRFLSFLRVTQNWTTMKDYTHITVLVHSLAVFFGFCLLTNTTRQQLRCYKSRSP